MRRRARAGRFTRRNKQFIWTLSFFNGVIVQNEALDFVVVDAVDWSAVVGQQSHITLVRTVGDVHVFPLVADPGNSQQYNVNVPWAMGVFDAEDTDLFGPLYDAANWDEEILQFGIIAGEGSARGFGDAGYATWAGDTHLHLDTRVKRKIDESQRALVEFQNESLNDCFVRGIVRSLLLVPS